ncbi:EAL domain-containing protein [Photobacterium phosphoreum]|uniref:EAL domain-containing protein n=2 Tax=Photobacterium phosphoreum TaxID=659 RepID=UPI0005D454C4|nr:EAL domain-containing protein [Photobacterium phosphoreum]KJF88575.1 hypothetical protein UB41_02490 [Photobacterium phosphoreum]PQJ90603.1 hypothetical protein BTO21_02300 [Photobacterium phosphoreum]PSV72107.1 hypothetical protein CTM77_04755 [Photobacterium phosphoreum]
MKKEEIKLTMKILIIENDKVQSDKLKNILFELNIIDLTILNDTTFIIKELQANSFDFIFCNAESADVVTILLKFVRNKETQNVIIMNSGSENISQLIYDMCIELNYKFVSILYKPFDVDSLKKLLCGVDKKKNQINVVKEEKKLSNSDVIKAFSENWIFLLYQPQFDFRNGDLLAVEALARIRHPIYGDIEPKFFLPIIEKMGLMSHLFHLVLEKATSALGTLGCNVKLSVNITKNILQEDICDFILNTCRKNNFQCSNVTLELTEEQAYRRTPKLLANLARLEINDIKLSIDDFGTGYASLEQLINLPVSEIKIDKKFISGICYDYKRQQMTKLLLFLAQSLGINCVAEGIEDKETWEYLRELGLDVCQGYYTGKPLPIHDLKELYNLFIETKKNQPLIYKSTKILIFIDNSLSMLALEKLLSKELKDDSIIIASNTDSINYILRDYPINYIISDILSIDKLNEINLEKKLNNNNVSLLLFIDKDEEYFINDKNNIIKIRKSGTLQEDVKNIIYKIQKNKSELYSEYDSLSKQEKLVTKLLIAGLTNKYIARELDLNEKTISTYKKRVLNKLNVKSTVELYQILGNR